MYYLGGDGSTRDIIYIKVAEDDHPCRPLVCDIIFGYANGLVELAAYKPYSSRLYSRSEAISH